jgi:hypothetical protein
VAGAPLSGWTTGTWAKGFRGRPQYAIAPEANGATYLFAMGGYNGDGTVLSDTVVGRIGASASVAGRPLPKPTLGGQALAIDGYVFVIGGKDDIFAGAGRPDTFSTKILSDGSLDVWSTTQPSLPEGRTSHALALSGDFLYVTGGGFDGPGLDTVYSSRVRFHPGQ